MPINNMLLPAMMERINVGNFGAMEGRTSHYGAINTLYNNTQELFTPAVMERIRATPPSREVKIPIFEKYAHTILTTRTCAINCQDISARLKTLTRTHLALDICVDPLETESNYTTLEDALQWRYKNAKDAFYTKVDQMGFNHIDLNKSTNMVPDANGTQANPLFKAKAGAYEVDTSTKFYAYLQTIMQQMDINSQLVDLTNTVANAETNLLLNPGKGTQLQTDALYRTANIVQQDYSNRVAVGTVLPVHYVMPKGSVGVLNLIDPVYQSKPVIGSKDDANQWAGFDNKSGFNAWGQTPDEVFNDWNWGVLQEVACVDERIVYKVKLSMDLIFATDFTSVAGETPIKRFDIKAMTA